MIEAYALVLLIIHNGGSVAYHSVQSGRAYRVDQLNSSFRSCIRDEYLARWPKTYCNTKCHKLGV